MKLMTLANAVRDSREIAYKAKEMIQKMPESLERNMIVELQCWILELTDILNNMNIEFAVGKDDSND